MARRSRSTSSQFHGVSLSDTIDRTTLILAFLIGAGGAIAMKLLGMHPFAIAGFSAAALITYALIAWVFGNGRMEPETVGDNCYYLGFLFTLTSLAFTLYQIADPSANLADQASVFPKVISGFGVALVSTIVGVFLRVFLMQIRPDIVARDREMRMELHQSARDMRAALSISIAELKNFATESVQLASERDAKLRKMTESTIESANHTLRDSTKTYSETIEVALGDATNKAVEKISASVLKSSKHALTTVRSSLRDLAAATEEFRDKDLALTEKLTTRAEQIEQRLEALEASVTKTVGNMDRFSEKLEKLSTNAEHSFASSLEQIDGPLATAAMRLDQTIAGITDALTKSNYAEKVSELSDALDEPVKKLTGVSETLAQASATLKERIEKPPQLAARLAEPAVSVPVNPERSEPIAAAPTETESGRSWFKFR